MIHVNNYEEFAKAYFRGDVDEIVLTADITIPADSPFCDSEGAGIEGTSNVTISSSNDEGFTISAANTVYLLGTGIHFEKVKFQLTGENGFDVTSATASFDRCNIIASGAIFVTENHIPVLPETFPKKTRATMCTLSGKHIAHVGILEEQMKSSNARFDIEIDRGEANSSDVPFILESDFCNSALSSSAALSTPGETILEINQSVNNNITITNIVYGKLTGIPVKQTLKNISAGISRITLGFSGSCKPEILMESDTLPAHSYKCFFDGKAVDESQINFKVNLKTSQIGIQSAFDSLRGCNRAEVWIPNDSFGGNIGYTLRNARNIALKGESGEDNFTFPGYLILTDDSSIIVDGNMTVSKILSVDPLSKVLGDGSVTASGSTITELPIDGPFNSATNAVPKPMIGSAGSAGSDAGYNNAVLQKMIDQYGDRIRQIIFDNHIIAYIGYPSTNSVAHVTDLILETSEGVDLVGIRSATNDNHGRPQSWITWHPTSLIQSVLIMDEHSKTYRPNPMAIS